jgi:hypothetical protein
MKTILISAALVLVAGAAAAQGLAPQEMSTAEFTAGDTKMTLHLRVDAAGNVCQQYVATVTMSESGNDTHVASGEACVKLKTLNTSPSTAVPAGQAPAVSH